MVAAAKVGAAHFRNQEPSPFGAIFPGDAFQHNYTMRNAVYLEFVRLRSQIVQQQGT
jgi:hypothetical protein